MHSLNTGITTKFAPRKTNQTCQVRHQGTLFTVPAAPAQECGILVDQVVIDALRKQIPVLQAEAMRWVDDSFDAAASLAYDSIGRPSLNNIQSGWDIFSSLAATINVAT